MFAIRNPFDETSAFPAFSNTNSEFRSVPDDILLHKIIDQSPVDDIARNMIIEFAGGTAVMIIQANPRSFQYTKDIRKSLNKTASALSRDLLHAYLPIELMEQIRTATNAGNA